MTAAGYRAIHGVGAHRPDAFTEPQHLVGVGRENGLQAIEHYTQLKTIYANLGDIPDYF